MTGHKRLHPLEATMTTGNFVYLYRTVGGAARYVGFGHDAQRAMSHAKASRNTTLKDGLEAG